jgi:hypothetical protein
MTTSTTALVCCLVDDPGNDEPSVKRHRFCSSIARGVNVVPAERLAFLVHPGPSRRFDERGLLDAFYRRAPSLRSPDNQSWGTFVGLCPRRSYCRCFILSCSTRLAVIDKTPSKADAASADSGVSAVAPTETSVFESRRATATSLIPIYCEWIEALGTLRWSCSTAIARFLNPVPVVA